MDGRVVVVTGGLWGDLETAKTQRAREVIRFGGRLGRPRDERRRAHGGREWGELTMGLLPSNRDGAVGIDELDKFDPSDQNGILESIETGFVSVNRGKFVNIRLPAEVIIVATAKAIDRERHRPLPAGAREPLRLRDSVSHPIDEDGDGNHG